MNAEGNDEQAHGQISQEQQCPPKRPPTQDATSSDCTPNSPPQKTDSSSRENSFYPGCSPVARLDASSQQGDMGQYFQENNEYYQEQHNEYASELPLPAAEDSQEAASSTLRQNNENCTEEPTEEGLIFEDSSYGDEIARWMEDQRHLQQQQLVNGQAQQRGMTGDDSSIILTEPTTEALSSGAEKGNNKSGSGISSENPSKRPASELSNSSSSQKLSPKRRQRSQSTSQLAPPDNRSPSRKRMDTALHERSQSQIELRAALLALKKAQAIVSGCRSRYNAARARVQDTAKDECESLLGEETPWNDMFHKLKKYKVDAGDCNVKQNFGAEDNKNSPEMVRRLSAWVGKNRKDGKLRGRGVAVSTSGAKGMHEGKANEESDIENAPPADQTATNGSPDEIADISCGDILQNEDRGDESSVFHDVDPDSIHADPYKEIALDGIAFDWNPRNSRWLQMYEELRRYKYEHGNTLVPHAQSGLGAWVKRQQVQYTLYSRGDGTKSDLTEERVRSLNDLGFIWSRRTNTWNENFQRLVSFRQKHGSCHIPDDSKDPELVTLHKWVADQRLHYKRQVADEEGNCSDDPNATDKKDCDEKASGSDCNNATKKKSKRKLPKLSHDKIAKLQSIGFEFDSRDAKWLQKLDVLLKYKQSQGDFLVPSNYPDDPTLSNWVASQRAQYKLYKKGSKSHMTERRLKILTDAGFPFSVTKVKKEAAHQDRVIFDAKPWLEKYKDFLLCIATHGSLETLQKTNHFLAEWVAKQRDDSSECATAVNEDENQSNPELKEHSTLMEAAHFFLFSQSNRENVLLLRDKNVEPASVIREESSWDDQFGNLAAWYIKHGTYAANKSLAGGGKMPSKMKKFVSNTLQQHRLFTSGLDSELTPERIEKLEDIHFPFDKASTKEPRDDDMAAFRRNRSWEDHRLDLAISYILKGTFDSNSLDDVELRRWAAEQKRQHKLYLAGKQTALTSAQIQKLMDIKFISKRPKQKSWSENCADLMAFRIQFGTFDVASAHVVTNAKGMPSKGRSANPCTNNTALKNLQEWVVKLRGHYCESSKSVSMNDELTQDQKVKLDSVGFPWTGSWAIRGELSDNDSCSLKQQEKTDVPAECSASVASIKSNLFGMTLEMQQVSS